MSMNNLVNKKTGQWDPPVIACTAEEGKTKQSEAKAANINTMVANYKRTGAFENVSRIAGQYEDITEMGDYKDSCNRVVRAQELFGALPATVRERFQNDPEQMIKFVLDKNNRTEAEKLGLVKKQKIDPPTAEKSKNLSASEPKETEPKAKEPKAIKKTPKTDA